MTKKKTQKGDRGTSREKEKEMETLTDEILKEKETERPTEDIHVCVKEKHIHTDCDRD